MLCYKFYSVDILKKVSTYYFTVYELKIYLYKKKYIIMHIYEKI